LTPPPSLFTSLPGPKPTGLLLFPHRNLIPGPSDP